MKVFAILSLLALAGGRALAGGCAFLNAGKKIVNNSSLILGKECQGSINKEGQLAKGVQCSVKCNPYYNLEGPDGWIKCEDNGSLDKNIPTCTKIVKAVTSTESEKSTESPVESTESPVVGDWVWNDTEWVWSDTAEVIPAVNDHSLLGKMINFKAERNSLQSVQNLFDDIGKHNTNKYYLINPMNKPDCVIIKNASGNGDTADITEKRVSTISEFSEEISHSLGISGGFGPVVASVSTSWGSSKSQSTSISKNIYNAVKKGKEEKLDFECYQGKFEAENRYGNFEKGRIEWILESLEKLEEYSDTEYPGATDPEAWEEYWRPFNDFVNEHGTHLVTSVTYGARAIKISQSTTNSIETSQERSVELGTEFSIGPASIGNSVGESTSDSQFNSRTNGLDIEKVLGFQHADLLDWNDLSATFNAINVINSEVPVAEKFVPIWEILEDLPQASNYKRAIKNLAHWIAVYQIYGPEELCKCADVKESNQICTAKTPTCLVEELPSFGLSPDFMRDIDVLPLNGCADSLDKTNLNGLTYYQSANACKKEHGSCTCKDLKNPKGYGNCQKEWPEGKKGCYIDTNLHCPDAKVSITKGFVSQRWSNLACENIAKCEVEGESSKKCICGDNRICRKSQCDSNGLGNGSKKGACPTKKKTYATGEYCKPNCGWCETGNYFLNRCTEYSVAVNMFNVYKKFSWW